MNILSKKKADNYYNTVKSICSSPDQFKNKILNLGTNLEDLFKEITKNEVETFANLHTRQKYIEETYNIAEEISQSYHKLRMLANNVRHESSFVVNNDDYIKSVERLMATIEYFSDVPIPMDIWENTVEQSEETTDAYFKKGDYNQAIAHYDEAIRLDPNNAVAYTNRGIAYSYKDDYNKAIADFTQAIRLDPNNALAYYNRGGNYYNAVNYNKAIADFTQAIRLDPNDFLAYFARGSAYYAKNDYIQAIIDYTEVLKLDPNNIEAKQWLEEIQKKLKNH
ncbi:hypothetical protein FACS189476_06760 [Spirochaetia bacterium]|nr:hypothetical protein FACS189476_06760 [Spirochaetia bacterium]